MINHLFRNITIILLLLIISQNISGCSLSDEQVLRKEFEIPQSANLITLNSTPKTSGNFGREGLKIDATFKFSSSDFNSYLNKVQENNHWKSLPLSRDFLIKITGVRRVIESLQRAYEIQEQPIPKPGSIYNPTEVQLLEEWKTNLPLDVKNGFYRCLTAGDNLMKATKVSCSDKPGDLNDFMLAILDIDNQILRVKVHTAY